MPYAPTTEDLGQDPQYWFGRSLSYRKGGFEAKPQTISIGNNISSGGQ